MKKTLIYIIATVSLAILLSVSVFAYNQDAYDTVYSGLSAAELEIDLSEYNISATELKEIFDKIVRTSPDLFFVNPTFEYSYSDATGFVVSMIPKYSLSGSELTTAKSTYNSFITSITSGVKSSWSELEKALYIHDAIALRLEYNINISNVYSAALSGSGNCTAYSLAYIAACRKVGLTCESVVSESMSHMWNIIKIDGYWYHVDVTWDDPTANLFGRVCHNNFLLSDSAIKSASSTEHNGWASEYTCSSTRFDSACWRKVNSPFVYASDRDWYAVNPTDFTLSRYDLSSSAALGVAYINDKWSAGGSSFYVDPYSGTGVYDDFVYFNSPTKIYSYNVKTGSISTVFTLDAGTGNQIYFISVSGSTLTYYLSQSPNVTQPSSGTVNLKKEASTYTVTFILNGKTVASYDYAEGAAIATPTVALIDGYLFKGWSELPETMPAQDITVEAILEVCPHQNAENQIITAATCTKDGSGQMVCTDCGHIINSYTIEGKHGFGDWTTVTEADCTHDGLRRRYCPTCGAATEEEVIPAYSAHKFGDWVILVEATEEKDGERERHCERCDFVEKQTYSVDIPDDTTYESTDTDTKLPDSSSDSSSSESNSSAGTSADTTGTQTGSDSKIKDFFVYFTIFVIVVSCVIGIVLIYRYAFCKKKPGARKENGKSKKFDITKLFKK